MKRYVSCLVVTLFLVAVARDAAAVLITSSTAGTLLNTGFESDAVGSTPSGWTSTGTPSVEVVTTGTGSPPAPAPVEGVHALEVGGNAVGAYFPFPAALTSGTVTATFEFYLPGITGAGHTSDNTLFTTFQNTNSLGFAHAEEWIGFASADFMNQFTGTSLSNTSGGVYYYSGVHELALTAGGTPYSFSLGAWHEATIAYTLNGTNGSVAITVDGTTLDALPEANTRDTGTASAFEVYQNSVGVGYVDAIPNAVPEPTSGVLCGIGALGIVGLLLRKRRAARR